jgi:hypothetical protein
LAEQRAAVCVIFSQIGVSASALQLLSKPLPLTRRGEGAESPIAEAGEEVVVVASTGLSSGLSTPTLPPGPRFPAQSCRAGAGGGGATSLVDVGVAVVLASFGQPSVRGSCELLGAPTELPAPPAVPALAPGGRKWRGGSQRERACGCGCLPRRDRRGGDAPTGDGRTPDRSPPMGASGRAQPGRRSVRRSGSTRAQWAGGGGVAAASLARVGRARGYRQRGGRPDRDRVCIETKSRTFDARHLTYARQTASWLRRRRRRWCRVGAFPVLCVVHAHGLEGIEAGVLVVSLDRLVPALRARAGTSPRPGFLTT